ASPFSAQVVAQYCLSGYWEQHIVRLCTLYQARRDRMLSALDRSMPPGVTWTRPEGGFFIWLTLPSHVLAHDVTRNALDAGVSVATGDAFFLSQDAGQQHLRLAYSAAMPEELDSAVHTLARVITELMEKQA